MVNTNQETIEPTPEFEQDCMNIIHEWESSKLSFQDAITRLTGLRETATANDHIINQGRTEQLLAYLYHYRGNLDDSIYHNERARILYNRANNIRRVGIIDLNQGENYRFKGDYSRALALYQSAKRIAQQVDDMRSQLSATVNEGLALIALEHYPDARRTLEQALLLTGELSTADDVQGRTNRRMLCEIHHGLAIIKLHEGKPEEAIIEAEQALSIADMTGDPILRGFANRTMGEALTEMSLSDTAGDHDPDVYFREALEAFKTLNTEAELARTMYAQAKSLAKRGRKSTAVRILQHVMIIFSRLGMVDDAARTAETQLALI
jgi:tetratricopeptide (TPR) repeat protein